MKLCKINTHKKLHKIKVRNMFYILKYVKLTTKIMLITMKK